MAAILSSGWHSPVYQTICRALWVGAVVMLPITSLPLLVDLSGSSSVAPPSVVLLILLVALWGVPYVFQRELIPVEATPLLAFVGVAVVAWAEAFFAEIPPFRGKTILTEAREAFITLAMGVVVYLATAAFAASSTKTLRLTLRLVNWSGLVVILWSLVQAIYAVFYVSQYPNILVEIQNVFVARHAPLFFARVTGVAYEPSWLAHQLNLVYLPLWLAASLYGYTAHPRKVWRLSVENLLLAGGVLELFLSFSRVGWVSFLLVVAFVVISANLSLIRRILHGVFARWKLHAAAQRFVRPVLMGMLLIVFLAAYAGATVGLAFVGAQFEPRLGRIFQEDLSQAGGFFELTNQLAFAERVVYWASGFEIFGDHPLLGVGLGNAGFYFPDKMPAYGHALVEVDDLFNRQGFTPNTKSLWVRLLAETGIVGFAVFASWLFVLWQSGQLARGVRDPLLRTLGAAGQFALIAFLVEGFSIDSFALPYVWFAAGLLSAAGLLARRASKPEDGV